MKKMLTLFIAGLILLLPTRANAVSYHSYGVTSEEKALVIEEKTETRNFLEELEYRMLEKDENYDFTDYMILAIIIILIIVVIVELNKKTYIVRKGTVFEEPISNDNQTIDNQEKNNIVESNAKVKESEEVSEEVSNNN